MLAVPIKYCILYFFFTIFATSFKFCFLDFQAPFNFVPCFKLSVEPLPNLEVAVELTAEQETTGTEHHSHTQRPTAEEVH